MHCDEKKQICLNYASNVPEWQLGLTLGALADIGEAVSTLGKVQKAVAGDLAWTKNNPDCVYMGTIPTDRALACKNAADALGKAMYALEVVLTQSSLFPTAKDLAIAADAAYNVQQTLNHVQQAKAAQIVPQPAYAQGNMDDFAVISDTDDLPF